MDQIEISNSADIDQLRLRVAQLEQENSQLRLQLNNAVCAPQQKLLQSEQRYSSLYSTMKEGVVYGKLEYDAAGYAVDCIVLDVNPACGVILERNVESLIGASLSQLFPSNAQQNLAIIAAVVDGGEQLDYELALPHLKKTIHLSISRPESERFAAILNDISASKKAQQEIERLAYYDTLTGLPNRALISDRLSQAMVQADRSRSLVGALVVDIDHFKKINDSLGVGAGDKVLCLVAQRLQQNMRQGDSIARMGGDEFVIVLSGNKTKHDIISAACKVLDLFAEVFCIDKHELTCTVSVGIAFYPTDADNAELLLKNADTAMYHAKETGRNHYQFYSPDMNIRAFEHLFLNADLQRAISRDELEVYYQPQLDLHSEKVVGVEALLRWHHPQKGTISPGLFIPIAEESDLILELGQWVLHQACEQARCWYDDGFTTVRVAVNLSARQFNNELPNIVATALHQTQLPPNLLELELTESLLMDKKESASIVLAQLQCQGVQLSIDDFGTGYSSLSYLKHFPLNRLKIDRSFIKDLTSSSDDEIIIEAIIALAHGLRLKVVAEGVETVEQLNYIRNNLCDEVQGFLFAEPMPAADLSVFLYNHQSR